MKFMGIEIPKRIMEHLRNGCEHCKDTIDIEDIEPDVIMGHAGDDAKYCPMCGRRVYTP